VRKPEYLSDPTVSSFMVWMQERLDKPGSFVHQYVDARTKTLWSCTSLYSAFESYEWKFDAYLPVSRQRVSGRTFADTHTFFNRLATELTESIGQGNNEKCKECCLSVLAWGGVLSRNAGVIKDLAESGELCSELQKTRELLNLETYDTSKHNGILINSGFTKIYSLLSDGFIMYDGRVGAALGLLVRKFCEDQALDAVPELLRFGYKRGREANYSALNRRNPSTEIYRFPEISNNPGKHLNDNVKASWLLGEIIRRSDSLFSQLDSSQQVMALQAALFMIGYDVQHRWDSSF